MKKLCIYHGNCADGFGAAWVVRGVTELAVEFYPGVYQQQPPDVTGRDVIMVDFSYKRPVILDMAKKATSILIIDHHQSAENDLVDLPENVTTVFDMNHSGAMLTWKHFHHPLDRPPKLLEHIQDRDLWRFKLPFTREIQAAVFSYPYDFDVWDDLFNSFDQFGHSRLIGEGQAIERKHHKDIAELVEVCKRRMVIGGYGVWVASLPYTLTSDAGHLMAEGEPFAACYWDTPETRTFSLRSQDGGIDVQEIAVQYGGGGHKHAAGFAVPRNHVLATS